MAVKEKTETRTVTLVLDTEARGEGGELKVSGHAAVFDSLSHDLGGFREQIRPGAFAKAIKRGDAFLLWGHERNTPLARVSAGNLELSEDARGLRFKATMAPTQAARDAMALVRSGVVRSMSFAFSMAGGRDDWEQRGGETIRTIHEVGELFEVSFVPEPAYEATGVDELRQKARRALAELEATSQTRGRLKARPSSPYTVDGDYSWIRDRLVVEEAARQAQAMRYAHYDMRGVEAAAFEILTPNLTHGTYRDAEERLRRFHDSPEFRAANTTTSTAGGGFALANAPVHVSEAFATAARAAATLTSALDAQPLPEKGMSVKTPRITTGLEAKIQATENADPGASVAVVEAAVESPVTTIYGWIDASMQLVDRAEPGFDVVAARELGEVIGLRTDQALLTGTGTAPELRGLLNVSSITSVAYTDASPTQAEFWPKLLEAWSTASTALGRDLDTIVMHPRRWAWMKAWKDSSTGAPAVLDWPGRVVTCGAIATNQGAGTNEDVVLILRRDELPALLGPISVEVYREVGGHTGTVRIHAKRYASALFGRRPEAIAKVSGTGLGGVTFA